MLSIPVLIGAEETGRREEGKAAASGLLSKEGLRENLDSETNLQAE